MWYSNKYSSCNFISNGCVSDDIIKEKCTIQGQNAGIIAGVRASLITTGLFVAPILYLNKLNTLNQDEKGVALFGSLDILDQSEEI
jgi:hypothetical protein